MPGLIKIEQAFTEDKEDGKSKIEVGGYRLHHLLPQLWMKCVVEDGTNQES